MFIPLDIYLLGILSEIADADTPTFFATWQDAFGTTEIEVMP